MDHRDAHRIIPAFEQIDNSDCQAIQQGLFIGADAMLTI